MKRGEIRWASLPGPSGSGPGFRRPVIVVQSNPFNASRIATVVVAVLTSNLKLAEAPGNVRLAKRDSGLTRPSVVNLSQILTLDRQLLGDPVRRVSDSIQQRIDEGLRLSLGLG